MKLIGIDPGSERTGVIVLEENKIRQGYNIQNDDLLDFIAAESAGCKVKIIVEDVKPFNMRITNEILITVKFLGWIEGKLKEAGHVIELIPRHQVKLWVFLQYKSIALPEIEKKIIRAAKRKEKECIAAGEPYIKRNASPTFVYVDDRIVANAMRKLWDIKKPRPGQRVEYGLKDHSWQALGLCSFFLANGTKI